MLKKYIMLFFAIFLITLVAGDVSALGLSGQTLSPIRYEPGKQITNEYIVSGTKLDVNISVSGDFAQYASVTPLVNGKFTLIIKFPQQTPPTGEYMMQLRAAEQAKPGTGGAGSVVAVGKNFKIEVYSTEKDVKAELKVPNVNQGDPINVNLVVTSWSYQNIDAVKADFFLYDASGKELSKKTTEAKPLPKMSGVQFETIFDEQLTPGQYTVKAKVMYDGKEKLANSSLKVGTMDIKLLNYSKELATGYSEFSAKVSNEWGNPSNVYAQLLIDNKMIVQTPTASLAGWEQSELKSIAKIDFVPGEYDAVIRLFYDGLSKDEQVKITVVSVVQQQKQQQPEKEQPAVGKQGSPLMTVVILLAVVFVIGIILLLVMKKKPQEQQIFSPSKGGKHGRKAEKEN